MEHFGFGDFVFQTPDGKEVGRANNLNALEEQLHHVPDESILFHAERNHFSNWLKARTEFWLAHQAPPRKVSDFASVGRTAKRADQLVAQVPGGAAAGVITEFSQETFDPETASPVSGGGSLGGKGRGLGFINTLISNYNLRDKFSERGNFRPLRDRHRNRCLRPVSHDNQSESFAVHQPTTMRSGGGSWRRRNFPRRSSQS